MADQGDSEGTVECTTCGTTFPASDTQELAKHDGHELVHVDPGG
jgi:hypothetical protein